MPRLLPDLARQSQFSLLQFRFPKVNSAFKGKGFQDDESMNKHVMVELNAVPLEAFDECFQKHFE
jgi:hypothetical protein